MDDDIPDDRDITTAYIAGLVHARREDGEAFGLMLDGMTKQAVYFVAWEYARALAATVKATDEQLQAHLLEHVAADRNDHGHDDE
ncbi:hypothetical protein HDA40_003435 [Hamadaea flava]|uniref:Uncharacterized protein n=1 Tax=Hamadaea flava TaxID=1742688 RepID=A0ABV8LIZ0_9ACTN|nr:hypothetical protein [Hamadaea flava]MCP2324928.1 hypothetical protein [Hamadaea flava]